MDTHSATYRVIQVYSVHYVMMTIEWMDVQLFQTNKKLSVEVLSLNYVYTIHIIHKNLVKYHVER